MHVWNLLHVARWKYSLYTGRKNDAKNRHLGTIAQLSRAVSSQLRHVSTIAKKLAKQQYLLHIMVPQYGELRPTAAEIDWRVWGTPATFNGLRVLASLMQRRRSTEANQTLHDVWPSPGLVDYLYTFGGCCPVTVFCHLQNSLCVLQVLHTPILAALLHGTRAVGASQTLRRWAHGATYIQQGNHHVGHWPTF